MTFGRSFTYKGHQVHYDKLGHDHWIDLLFFNRELQSLVVVELKKGQFKPSYLGQLAAYLQNHLNLAPCHFVKTQRLAKDLMNLAAK